MVVALKRSKTELSIPCPCGGRAPIMEGRSYYALCLACGRKTFFKSPILLERVRLGGPLCPHKPEPKPCKGGFTTWCPLCRVRTFIYEASP